MNNETDIGIKFKNSVIGQKKLEEYAKTLNTINTILNGIDQDKASKVDSMTKSNSKFNKSQQESKKSSLDYNKAIQNMSNTLRKELSSSIDKVNSKIKKVFKVSTIIAFEKSLKGVTTEISGLVDASASYLESFNLSQVAFQGNTTEVEKLTNRMSEMYGLDEAWSLKTASNFKQLANAMGLTDDVGTKLSTTLAQLSVDLSSLYNVNVEEASSKLQSALAGQTKPIRSFGADITEATLQQTLLANGINRTVDSLSYAEKRLVIVASILQQTDEAQGDWGRTIESVANQTRIMNEQLSRLKRSLGNMILPLVKGILPWINAILMVLVEITSTLATLLGYNQEEFNFGFGDTSDSVSDLTDELDNATDSAKKLKSGLRGFDKLNVITTPSDSASGTGTNGLGIDSGVLDLFNKASDDYLNSLNKVSMKATQIRDTILEWLGFTKQTDEATDDIYFTYKDANATLTEIIENISKRIAEGLNKLTTKENFTKIGENLANALNFGINVLDNFFGPKGYDFTNFGKRIADSINVGLKKVDFAKVGELITAKLLTIPHIIYGIVSELDWSQLGKDIGTTIKNIDWGDIWNTAFGIFKEVFSGLGEALISIIKEAGWAKIGEMIATILVFTIAPILIKNLAGLVISGISSGITDKISGGISSKISGKSGTKDLMKESGLDSLLKSLGKATMIIAVLGGIALVLSQLTKLIEVFGKSGLSLGETLGLIGGTLGAVTVAFGAFMLVMDKIEPSWQSIAAAAVILGGLALVLKSVSDLLKVMGENGMKLTDIIGVLATVFGLILATMISVAVVGPAMTAGLIPFLVVVAGISAILLVMKVTLPTILDAVGKFIKTIAPSLVDILDILGDKIALIIFALGVSLPPIIESVGDLFAKIFNGISIVINSVGNTLVKILDSIGRLVDTVLGSLIRFIRDLGPAIETFVDSAIRSITKLINFIVIGIEYAVNQTVVKGINAIIKAINKVSKYINIKIDTVADVKFERFTPRLKSGMDYVPNDFYGPVYLDEGERVLTKQENANYTTNITKNNNKTSTFSPTIVVQVGNKQIAKSVLNDLQSMAKNNGKPITIGE